MKLQETLTKENFWDRMMQDYPNATKKFCQWIDEYKKAVNWDALFASNESTMQLHSSKYKFHEIPHAMQLGIWLEYINQRGGCQFEIEDFFEYDLAEDIEDMFKNLLEEEAINEHL